MRPRYRNFATFFILSTSLLFSSEVVAQRIPETVRREAERLQERDAEKLQEKQRIFLDSQSRPPSGEIDRTEDADIDSSSECISVRSARISGMSIYEISEYSDALNQLNGECTKLSAIKAILRAITNRYVNDGYVTSRALLSIDPNKLGFVEIVVVEGKIDRVAGPMPQSRPRYDSELEAAFPHLAGRVLNLRDLEQGVDQLARLGGSEPSIDILPGTTAGESDIIVRRSAIAPWIRPSLTISNDGAARTGRQVATLSLDVDSPFGAADFWSFYYIRDVERGVDRGVEGYGGFFSLPYGFTTLTLSGGRYQFVSVLESNELRFSNTGDSLNGSIGVDHLLFRDRRTKVSVSASLSFYDTVNRIQGIRLSLNSYRLVSVQIGARVQRRFGTGLVFADLNFARGLTVFGANAADIGPGSDGLNFRKFDGNLSYQTRLNILGIPTDYSVALRGQWALDPVLPAERLSIGGSSTVRGFRDDGISGRTGVTFRQQLGIGLLKIFSDARTNTATQLSAIVGYDAGAILPKRDDAFERGFLQSSTIGLRLLNRRMLAEVSVALPLSAPARVQRAQFELAASVRLTI